MKRILIFLLSVILYTNVYAEEKVFVEADFRFKQKSPQVQQYKDFIINHVNKLQEEYSWCKIDPTSSYISDIRSTKDKIVFYVTCGKGKSAQFIYFSDN